MRDTVFPYSYALQTWDHVEIISKILGQGNAGSTSALVSLGGHDLVVVCSQSLQISPQSASFHTASDTCPSEGGGIETYQANLLPRSNVVREGDGTASPLALADAEVLIEGLSALNAGSVGADDLVDVVSAAVAGHGAQLRAGRTGVVGSVGLDDIVLNEGARGPAVESEQRVATSVEASRVCDGAVCC